METIFSQYIKLSSKPRICAMSLILPTSLTAYPGFLRDFYSSYQWLDQCVLTAPFIPDKFISMILTTHPGVQCL